MDIWTLLTILTLACFVGYFVVWGVTPALHSPLMSVSNAISGIVIVGALITAGISEFNDSKTMGLIAVFLAAINIFRRFCRFPPHAADVQKEKNQNSENK